MEKETGREESGIERKETNTEREEIKTYRTAIGREREREKG